MFCKNRRCKKDIPDCSKFCLYCGTNQQETVKRMRRTKGTGCIYFNKKCRTNPYEVQINHKYVGCYATKVEAEQAVKRYSLQDYSDKLNATLKSIYDKWSPGHYAELTKGGRQALEAAWKYLQPISPLKMRDLTLSDYQAIIDGCNQKRATKAKIRQLISHLCKYAMADNIITKNYADYIKLPKDDTAEKDIFTQEQAQAIKMAADTDLRAAMIMILICTGLRVGELCGVERINVFHFNNPPYMIAGSKTDAGRNRIVPILSTIRNYIINMMEDGSESRYLIHNADGGKLDTNNFRKRYFKPCLKELGILTDENEHTLTPHSCRHTFATIASQVGVAPEALQEIIGHADYATTVDNYINQTDVNYLATELEKFVKGQ